MRRFLPVVIAAFFLSGCGNISTYVKPDAPWASLHRVAVLPFVTPSDNPTRRQLVTQLFAMELRKAGWPEVVEVPISGSMGTSSSLEQVAKSFQVDAVFSGSVDDSQGTILHIWLQDAATKEVIWSGTYLVGVASDFFGLRTQQQQIQRAIRRLVRELGTKKS